MYQPYGDYIPWIFAGSNWLGIGLRGAHNLDAVLLIVLMVVRSGSHASPRMIAVICIVAVTTRSRLCVRTAPLALAPDATVHEIFGEGSLRAPKWMRVAGVQVNGTCAYAFPFGQWGRCSLKHSHQRLGSMEKLHHFLGLLLIAFNPVRSRLFIISANLSKSVQVVLRASRIKPLFLQIYRKACMCCTPSVLKTKKKGSGLRFYWH